MHENILRIKRGRCERQMVKLEHVPPLYLVWKAGLCQLGNRKLKLLEFLTQSKGMDTLPVYQKIDTMVQFSNCG